MPRHRARKPIAEPFIPFLVSALAALGIAAALLLFEQTPAFARRRAAEQASLRVVSLRRRATPGSARRTSASQTHVAWETPPACRWLPRQPAVEKANAPVA